MQPRESLALFLCMVAITSCVSCVRAVRGVEGPVPDAVLEERMGATVAISVGCDVRLVIPPTRVGWAGSGVAMGDRYVLTAAHVVPWACLRPAIVATFPDGTKYNMVPDAVLATDDIARLMVKEGGTFGHTYPVKIASARAGDHVCLTPGNPQRGISCGRIKERKYGPDGRTADVWYDAPTIRGNSGSGLFNADGALVGIVVQWWRADDGVTSLGGKATAIGPFGRRWIASPP